MATSMNLSDVYVFKKVAATLSFTRAARQMGISRSAVSKQISRLEENLGVVLLNRTTRSVNLTEAGRTFDAQTEKIDRTIERAAELVRGADMSPLGTVSFAMPSGLGSKLMAELAVRFQPRWPELRLNVHVNDEVQDLITENLDLAIRISKKLTDSSLIARRLVSTNKVLAASPRYWRQHGMPGRPQDLANHRCLGLGTALKRGTTWTIDDGKNTVDVPIKFAFSTNNNLALIQAASLDSGVIYVPEICIASELADGHLEVVPDFVDPEHYGVYAMYPHRKAATKVKILVDFIENLLPQAAALNRWPPPLERKKVDSSNDDSAAQYGENPKVAQL